MIILHCLSFDDYNKIGNSQSYGGEDVEKYGFIHCSSIEYFWRVAPNFNSGEYILLCVETNLVESEIKWEDFDGLGRKYPHIYGELNTAAIVCTYPFLRNNKGVFVLNDELKVLIEQEV